MDYFDKVIRKLELCEKVIKHPESVNSFCEVCPVLNSCLLLYDEFCEDQSPERNKRKYSKFLGTFQKLKNEKYRIYFKKDLTLTV